MIRSTTDIVQIFFFKLSETDINGMDGLSSGRLIDSYPEVFLGVLLGLFSSSVLFLLKHIFDSISKVITKNKQRKTMKAMLSYALHNGDFDIAKRVLEQLVYLDKINDTNSCNALFSYLFHSTKKTDEELDDLIRTL